MFPWRNGLFFRILYFGVISPPFRQKIRKKRNREIKNKNYNKGSRGNINIQNTTMKKEKESFRISKKSKKQAAPGKSITWSSKRVKAKDINPTPNNYKIKSDLGRERLQTSLSKFGRAGTVVVNPSTKAGKYDLIDGNSRWQEVMYRNANEVMEVSIPNRRLTPAEYKEMSAMFDFAKAGEVDEQRILGDLGTSKDFYEKWGLEIPMEILEKMGKKANMAELEYPEEGQGSKKGKKGEAPQVSGVRMVQAFFTEQQEAEFRKLEEKFSKKFGVDNTTDFIFQCVKFTTKNKKQWQ